MHPLDPPIRRLHGIYAQFVSRLLCACSIFFFQPAAFRDPPAGALRGHHARRASQVSAPCFWPYLSLPSLFFSPHRWSAFLAGSMGRTQRCLYTWPYEGASSTLRGATTSMAPRGPMKCSPGSEYDEEGWVQLSFLPQSAFLTEISTRPTPLAGRPSPKGCEPRFRQAGFQRRESHWRPQQLALRRAGGSAGLGGEVRVEVL